MATPAEQKIAAKLAQDKLAKEWEVATTLHKNQRKPSEERPDTVYEIMYNKYAAKYIKNAKKDTLSKYKPIADYIAANGIAFPMSLYYEFTNTRGKTAKQINTDRQKILHEMATEHYWNRSWTQWKKEDKNDKTQDEKKKENFVYDVGKVQINIRFYELGEADQNLEDKRRNIFDHLWDEVRRLNQSNDEEQETIYRKLLDFTYIHNRNYIIPIDDPTFAYPNNLYGVIDDHGGGDHPQGQQERTEREKHLEKEDKAFTAMEAQKNT